MRKRGSGILLHPTSLPSPYGIGDMGPWAYRFADFLAETKQSYWQILPLNPTDQGSGNSPYSSPSAFAGNILLLSPELLLESGFLDRGDLPELPPFPEKRSDFPSVISYKRELLNRAYQRFKKNGTEKNLFDEFCSGNRSWLEDYALYVVIKSQHQGKSWGEWEKDLRDRHPKVMEEMKNHLQEEIEREKFLQYLFFKQWFVLKRDCNEKGIKFIGDIPFYVNYDSVDVWTHPEIFKLDEEKKPLAVAGVPPDYFSKTGQLWGNPIYRWDILQKTNYAWWFERINHNLHLVDILRIDHFRGFVGFWEVPATEPTAVHGQWVEAPAVDFFSVLLEKFFHRPFLAEDLGYITEEVREVMSRFGFPGMRILQFGFDGDLAIHPYLPHNYVSNCVVYTGTHDNNTVRGWFENEATPEERKNLFRYLGREVSEERLPKELIRLLMMSIANTVIVPMQDLLGLGEEARMNRPSLARGNWEWRFMPDQLDASVKEWFLEMTSIYGRAL